MNTNDKIQYHTQTTLQQIQIQQITNEKQTSGAPIHQPMGILVTSVDTGYRCNNVGVEM